MIEFLVLACMLVACALLMDWCFQELVRYVAEELAKAQAKYKDK